jgi:hypothetical protein
MGVFLYPCLSYPACKSRLFCAVLTCVAFLVYLILPRYLVNGTIFGERLLNVKRVLMFYTISV